ncbi:sodium:proton antiporter NhaD [Prevotella sp. PINT]|jgi:Na+/H+ antiporter NhaD and related arsenite permeases|uniref:sodium:proton antiporter NhaD n=1 Tax=Palleniella intestinalis TaxID=2736291 RepID=UPI001555C4CC|nr:sodium:proton antiporter NhaD [Palleniella intestinalis]NPD81670.1 sodium:proton antiporter NhaD [Palleniella intestinalis]
MSTVTIIVTAFCIGYLFIAFEAVTKINKAAIAVLMCVVCWTLLALGHDGLNLPHFELGEAIERNLGEAGTTLFFLMGAMTIVEIVDQHGGFNWVRSALASRTKRSLLWKIAFMTAILSAVLDNLTTSIVMIMILRKLVADKQDRMWYAVCVIIAANAGGAFSPIGDVTTIMLWNGKMITALGVISEIIVPSFVAFIIPTAVMQMHLKGNLPATVPDEREQSISIVTKKQRMLIFALGVGGLCCVPVFHTITELPAFMGILGVLGILWSVTEVIYRKRDEHDPMAKRVTQLLTRIDIATILFFLGILMAVATLSEIGVLTALGQWLDETIGNHYLVTGAIGVLSSIVDNVPLVAGAMKMYAIDPAGGAFGVDGVFWQLLAYCAGVGGSMLIIGSAAGVVVMGLERISFGWYMKNVTWIAFVGYLAGILCYWVEKAYIF